MNSPTGRTDLAPAVSGARRPERSRLARYGWVLGLVVLALAVAFPFVVDRPRFWIPNIGIKSIWLGLIAMSLVFLNRYVGLLSLAQVMCAGAAAYGAGYVIVTLGLPDVVAILVGLGCGTFAGFLTALVAARTKAIYFLMITLAIGQVFYSWASQAIEVTNARRGLAPLPRAEWGFLDFSNLYVFYFTALALAVVCYLACRYMVRTPFGLALQGIRDSPERMQALGYRVAWYRIGAMTFAAAIASVGGLVMAFDRGQVDPDTVSLGATLDVLVVAVIGGIGSLGGVFLGGIFLTLLDNFAGEFTERYLTLTGLVFIAVLVFAPNGLAGIPAQVRRWWRRRRDRRPPAGPETSAGPAPAGPETEKSPDRGPADAVQEERNRQ